MIVESAIIPLLGCPAGAPSLILPIRGFSVILMHSLRSSLFFAGLAVCAIAGSEEPHTPPVLLQMIRDDAIHRELNLTASQRTKVIAALPTVDGRWFRTRKMPADRQRPEIQKLESELQQTLRGILNPSQSERLGQLRRQALGTRMVLLDDVASGLALTSDQRQSFKAAFARTDQKVNELQKRVRGGELDATDANREATKLKAEERQALVDRLSNEQRAKLGELTGSSFNFAQVKRMYPMAPELRSEGVTWIQGQPVKLESLRGKVVAVHYYAFQCINCKRNLPHYKAWHDDYSDKDLVVIGIQYPETSSERNPERVASAAKSEGIEYPVMLDLKGSNWDTWANTMWPTVYLIDKQGFIRRWWEGELNWKGTPGEQQMRETIEMLLAEDS